ncbi:MAG: hypothetical protein ABI690_05800 [Chloroflexota bacterium]
MTETIVTLHPDPSRQGVNISKQKYDTVRTAILNEIQSRGEVALTDLFDTVVFKLGGKFSDAIVWYLINVKPDLEARGLIEFVPDTNPPRLRLVSPK